MSDHKRPTEDQIDALAWDIRALAAVLDADPTTITRAMYRAHRGATRTVTDAWGAAKARLMGAPEGFAIAKVTTTIKTADGSKSTTVVPNTVTLEEAVLPGHRIDRVSTFRRTEDGNPQWVKTKAIQTEDEDTLTRLLRDLPSQVPVREGCIAAPSAAPDDDLVSVVCIGDAHIGAFAWARESGDDYDLTIAEDLMAAAISDLVTRGPNTRTGLLVNLGDFFTADGAEGTTTAGTPQHTDSRFPKVLETGQRMIVHAIDCMLAKHAEVIVDCQAGNHDSYTAIMLAIGLKAHYRNEARVSIPVDPAKRHYHRFGQVLVGTTHGDGAKIDALPSLMAAEAAEMWGLTRHRYFYLGHFHHTSKKDFPGCTVETFRTLAGRDAWHASKGYLAPRDMQRIVLHKAFGEISREIANVDYLRARLAL